MADAASYAPYICGLIIAAGTWLAIGGLLLRQRSTEALLQQHKAEALARHHATERRNQRRRISEARKRIAVLARVVALESKHTRAELIDQLVERYGPSRGDAE